MADDELDLSALVPEHSDDDEQGDGKDAEPEESQEADLDVSAMLEQAGLVAATGDTTRPARPSDSTSSVAISFAAQTAECIGNT